MKTEIVKIESGIIECPVVNDQRYVAIKPVCEMLGIDVEGQRQVIKNHPLLNTVITLIDTIGADNKMHKMTCLPLRYFFLWLENIHPKKVKKDVKVKLLKYQKLVYDTLFDKFINESEFNELKNERKSRLIKQLGELNELEKKLKKQLKTIEDLTWEDFKTNNRQLKIDFAN